MKRKTPLLLAMTFALCGCNVKTQEKEESNMKEILSDTSFKEGFDLMMASTETRRAYASYLNYGGKAINQDKSKHAWQMAQWWTPYDFKDASFKEDASGVYEYSNESRSVKVDTNKGELTLSLNSNVEYQKLLGHSRTGSESWSHLLIEQDIQDPPKIKELSHVYVSLDFSIDKVNNLDENQAIPAAQFLWYLTITNPENGNTAYESEVNGKRNQFMWFGIPIFDSRYDFVSDYVHADAGFVGATNTIIYTITSRNYLDEKIQYGKKYHIEFDALPYIRRAYVYGLQEGIYSEDNYEKMIINYMNLGWELPGSFDASATISGISIKIEKKEASK